VIRTGAGPVPPPDAGPTELAGQLLALPDLHATTAVRIDNRPPDATHTLYLTGDMGAFEWRINARAYNASRPFDGITPLDIRAGQRVRLGLINQTPMYHPMHLHGHTVTVRGIGHVTGEIDDLPDGTRKDTVMVGPGERVSVEFTADNPGQWLVHCHNAYHLATGMTTIVSYRAVPAS